jgi:3-hydroxymyristoyl/3-hydroxydecanoyl-(acyl carrier protein) dehydratase
MARDDWRFITRPGEKTQSSVVATFQVPEDSSWFAGHFPEEPILPGVAILFMVTDLIGQIEGSPQRKTRIAGLKRVRFRLPVRPNDTVTVVLTRENAGRVNSYGFQARIRGEIACTGAVLTGKTGVG